MRGKPTTPDSTCRQCGGPVRKRPDRFSRFCSRRCYRDYICPPLSVRFWARVDKNGPIPDHHPTIGPCWLWTGGLAPNGYGRLEPGDGETRYAHRISYKMHVGPIAAGMDCCHRCDVRACVRPDHLFEGTRRDNVQDMVAKGRARGRGSKRRIHTIVSEKQNQNQTSTSGLLFK
jgi:hypothetical protein